jgi:hypothetical protein
MKTVAVVEHFEALIDDLSWKAEINEDELQSG